MIYIETKLNVLDNSGSTKVKCIKTFSGFKNKKAKLGDTILVAAIKKYTKKVKKIKNSKTFFCLIVTVKQKIKRKDGSFIKTNRNSSLLISESKLPLSTIIKTPICQEIRDTKKKQLLFKKIISLSKVTI
jgi:large subunit ribosomal protein L14